MCHVTTFNMISPVTFSGTEVRLTIPLILPPALLIDWSHIHHPVVNWDLSG